MLKRGESPAEVWTYALRDKANTPSVVSKITRSFKAYAKAKKQGIFTVLEEERFRTSWRRSSTSYLVVGIAATVG